MASALPDFWLVAGHVSEGYALLERALASSEGVEAPVLAQALAAIGWLACVQGDYDQAEVWCRRSLALFREVGETHGIALSLYRLGCVLMFRGDNAGARMLLEESLAGFREVDDPMGISDTLRTLGECLHHVGKSPNALDSFLKLHCYPNRACESETLFLDCSGCHV